MAPILGNVKLICQCMHGAHASCLPFLRASDILSADTTDIVSADTQVYSSLMDGNAIVELVCNSECPLGKVLLIRSHATLDVPWAIVSLMGGDTIAQAMQGGPSIFQAT